MAKSELKLKAIKLRKLGKSINEIATQLGVSKSSVSIWCRNIELTPKQMAFLTKRMAYKKNYEGRIKGARTLHERRVNQIKILQKEGAQLISTINKKNLLILGIGLYAGEGIKGGRVGISNSDYRILQTFIIWLDKIWNVKKDRIIVRIGINKIHNKRIKEVEKYWSRKLKIPLSQFRKTTLIRTENKKVYTNFDQHYGTVKITVTKSGDLLHKILGLISCIYGKI